MDEGGTDPNAGKYKHSEATPSPGETPPKTGGAQGQTGAGLAGVWATTATDAAGNPRRELVLYDDGRYKISDNQGWKDTGIILARAGRIQMMSDATGVVVRSSFKFRTLSKIVTAGALGEEEWQRVDVSPGKDPDNTEKEEKEEKQE